MLKHCDLQLKAAQRCPHTVAQKALANVDSSPLIKTLSDFIRLCTLLVPADKTSEFFPLLFLFFDSSSLVLPVGFLFSGST